MRLLLACGTMVAVSWIVPITATSQTASTPPDVERLAFYVGRWREAGQMRDDPSKPFQTISGGETCSWSAGGYAVMCEEKTSGPGQGWEGVYILSYDAVAKQYHVYGTEKPGINLHAVGHLDGDRWVWLTDAAPDGTQLRYTFAPADGGARTMAVEVGDGHSWSGIVNVTYTLRR